MNQKKLTVLIILVAYAIMLSYTLFPFSSKIPLSFENRSGEYYVYIPKIVTRDPGLVTSARNFFNAPFDMEYYIIVVEDLSKVEDRKKCDIQWNATLDSDSRIVTYDNRVEFEKIGIEEYKLWGGNHAILRFDPRLIDNPAGCTFTPSNNIYATPYESDMMAKRLLVIVSILGLFAIALSIWDWVIRK